MERYQSHCPGSHIWKWLSFMITSSTVQSHTHTHNSLTGQIPSSFGLLVELSILYLSINHLSGKIPPVIGNCGSLAKLELRDNQLEGEIPSELGMLRDLKELHLYTNHLTGEIPTSI